MIAYKAVTGNTSSQMVRIVIYFSGIPIHAGGTERASEWAVTCIKGAIHTLTIILDKHEHLAQSILFS